ncbi:MAG: LuxR C-terminal-related transcriptional regulator [Sphingobium sp.]
MRWGESRAAAPLQRKVASRIVDNIRTWPISLIGAPPASGKTELLHQVMAGAARIGMQPSFLTIPLSARHAPVAEAVSILGAGDGGGRRLLIIDDFHRLPQADAGSILASAAEARGVALLIGADRPLRVPVASLRLKRLLIEYGMDDLALTFQEARELTATTMAEAMSRDFQQIMQATEGWMGAWRLVADRIANGESLTRIAAGFGGNAGLFSDFFEEEVLAHLPRGVRDFVTRFGMLSPLSMELASDLAGPGARQMWEEARRICPFFGQGGGWARALHPHPMFRSFLADRQLRLDPDAFAETLHAAADWFEKRRDWPEAIECLVAAGQEALAADKLRQNALEIFARFGDATLLLSRGFVSERAIRQIAPAIKPEAALIQRRLDPTTDVQDLLLRPEASAEEEFRAILACFAVERFEAVRRLSDRWLQREIRDSLQRATVAVTLSVACHACLDMRSMRQALELGSFEIAKATSPFIETWIAIEWAMYHIEGARPAAARHAIEALLNRASVRGLLRSTLEVVLAHVEYRLGRRESAVDLINRSLASGTRHATVDTMVVGWTTAARCALHAFGLTDALTLLEEAYAIIARRGGERGRLMLRLLACQLCLEADPRGRLAYVRSEMEHIQAAASTAQFGLRFQEQLKMVMARLMYEQRNLPEAISLVQPILRRTEGSERTLRWAEASILRIAIATAEGKVARALRMFWDCESATSDMAVRQLMLEEARLLAPTVVHLRAQVESKAFEARHRALVNDLAYAAGIVSVVPEAEGDDPVEAVRLTRIERRIMDLVAKGLSNREIAERLSNSILTVKWHLGNIYLKLGVKSRTAALARMHLLEMAG